MCARDDVQNGRADSLENADRLCDILNRSFAFDIDDDEYPDEWCYDEHNRPVCTAFLDMNEEPAFKDPLTVDMFRDRS